MSGKRSTSRLISVVSSCDLRRRNALAPSQSQVQLSSCVYPECDKDRGQYWREGNHGQASILERIPGHFEKEVASTKSRGSDRIARGCACGHTHITLERQRIRVGQTLVHCPAVRALPSPAIYKGLYIKRRLQGGDRLFDPRKPSVHVDSIIC